MLGKGGPSHGPLHGSIQIRHEKVPCSLLFTLVLSVLLISTCNMYL